jgi:hypothetical protein
MKSKSHRSFWLNPTLTLAVAVGVLAGCKSNDACCPATISAATTPPAPVSITPPTAPVPPVNQPVPSFAALRIKAGVAAPFTDSSGNVWLADQGFADGDTVERPDLKIENTKDPAIYHAERYSMSSFSQPVPNGKYVVKLHFAETYEGITGPGQRVFSFTVEGQEFKDFDVWAKAGGGQRAYVETVSVAVADGKLDIAFTPNVENPEINGIEILPGS